MQELLFIKADGDHSFSIVEPSNKTVIYSLVEDKEFLMSGQFIVRSRSGDDAAVIKREHVLFTPAKMPHVTVSLKDGRSFTIRKDIAQLQNIYVLEGCGLTVRGELFDRNFQLLYQERCIAEFHYEGEKRTVLIDEWQEVLAASFVFAAEMVR